ncbi:MAG: isoprenylcysteine carboxylmethyltransferase family protein [Pseudomonadota bacterium]
MSALRFVNLPPVWLVAFMAAAWLIAEVHAPWGDALLWVGRAMIGASLALMVWSAIAFRRARTTIIPHLEPSALVETGPYRFSRNPIYLADLVILAGWVLSLGSPLGLLLLAPFRWVLLRLFILPEEARLTHHLGQPYSDYCARVRRWI